jgi:predicted metal-dependent hydrolase
MINLAYKTVRSPKRRKLTISVERDSVVVVHAPHGTPDDDIRRIVELKRQWITAKLRHPQKYHDRRHPPGKEVVNGESAPYLGRDYRIQIAETGSGSVEFDRVFLVPAAHAMKRRKVLRDWYVARAKDKILARVAQHARSLGVSFSAARIVENRYRWGSCTIKDNVNFNWRLIKAPMFVIDYVIIHELVHLLEANHTARFWGIVRANTPTVDKAKAWLKEHGQILEEEI